MEILKPATSMRLSLGYCKKGQSKMQNRTTQEVFGGGKMREMDIVSSLDENIYNNKNKLYTDVKSILCESCYWSATLLKPESLGHIIYLCPICNTRNLSLIPLAKNESYKITIGKKRGLELEFLR